MRSIEPVVPIVIDTNVLVPSLYKTTHLFEYILSGNLVLVWNNFMYNEAVEIIKRLAPYYFSKTGTTSEQIISLLDLIFFEEYQVREMPSNWPPITTDRKDDPFLWAANEGKAEYIVSSDKRHMLRLRNYRGIPIGKPGTFWMWVNIRYPMARTNI